MCVIQRSNFLCPFFLLNCRCWSSNVFQHNGVNTVIEWNLNLEFCYEKLLHILQAILNIFHSIIDWIESKHLAKLQGYKNSNMIIDLRLRDPKWMIFLHFWVWQSFTKISHCVWWGNLCIKSFVVSISELILNNFQRQVFMYTVVLILVGMSYF